uniref:Uncharacterized protein n=1 Tax=Glossina brevipalpis TaxID=37001 RepID=A0A1A9WPL3_9MUSC
MSIPKIRSLKTMDLFFIYFLLKQRRIINLRENPFERISFECLREKPANRLHPYNITDCLIVVVLAKATILLLLLLVIFLEALMLFARRLNENASILACRIVRVTLEGDFLISR